MAYEKQGLFGNIAGAFGFGDTVDTKGFSKADKKAHKEDLAMQSSILGAVKDNADTIAAGFTGLFNDGDPTEYSQGEAFGDIGGGALKAGLESGGDPFAIATGAIQGIFKSMVGSKAAREAKKRQNKVYEDYTRNVNKLRDKEEKRLTGEARKVGARQSYITQVEQQRQQKLAQLQQFAGGSGSLASSIAKSVNTESKAAQEVISGSIDRSLSVISRAKELVKGDIHVSGKAGYDRAKAFSTAYREFWSKHNA